MSNFYENCGSLVKNDNNFCSSCGTPVKPAAPETPVDSDSSAAPSAPEEQYEPDRDLWSMFMRYDNRLNRMRYFLRSGALLLIVFLVGSLLDYLIAVTGMSLLSLIGYLLNALIFFPSITLTIRRLHDLNRPDWWYIGTFIPLVNLVLEFYLLFFKGIDGPNQYGPDPLGRQA